MYMHKILRCGVLLLAGCAVAGLAGQASTVAAQSAAAAPVATFNYGMTDFVQNGTTIYATVPSLNSIAEINPSTLQAKLIGIGSNPEGLALNSGGTTLYVANQGSNFIATLNTQTNQVGSPVSLGSGVSPLDVQVGTNGRLWVLTGAQDQFDSIEQISAATGASTGPGIGAYGGQIVTSPNGATLYYGNFGVSPSSEYQFNVSSTDPSVTWTSSLGGNGTSVDLSNDGTLVAFPQGGNAQNAIIQTSTGLTLGSVQSATSIAFSPDNSIAYTANSLIQGIRGFSTTTFLQTVNIPTVGNPGTLFVDNAGNYIFSDEGGSTEVYQTGAVPDAATIYLLLLGIAGTCLLRHRRLCCIVV